MNRSRYSELYQLVMGKLFKASHVDKPDETSKHGMLETLPQKHMLDSWNGSLVDSITIQIPQTILSSALEPDVLGRSLVSLTYRTCKQRLWSSHCISIFAFVDPHFHKHQSSRKSWSAFYYCEGLIINTHTS